jgi:acyl transferase domain-containing protein
MSGRFPQAPDLDKFWENLANGVESISFFSDEEIARIDPSFVNNPDYVKAGGVLEGIRQFDASFFQLSPFEAQIMDPQQRFFLECSWEALENAGYDPHTYSGPIGVFAAAGLSFYLFNLSANPRVRREAGDMQLLVGNDKDHIATRVSYKLNLRGPSVTVQTACSSSLVAVHVACQSLLNGECDMALAGGVSISNLYNNGYFYYEGGITSRDGHCRPFDEQAGGTVSGDGVGVVLLKRRAEAEADGDEIKAVIKGTAVNNDGSQKVGYTAPSVSGQAGVISMAQEVAGVQPEEVSYVEAHGTATGLGDPIEVAALTQAFGGKGHCGLGSVKSNIGHLDTAAGVAGLIKTVLMLQHRQLVPSLHYQRGNAEIRFEETPFYVNTQLREWKRQEQRRLVGGVSSFGIGGTNAHVIVEEAPERVVHSKGREWQVLLWSARTKEALSELTERLGDHLERSNTEGLAEEAYTLAVGRRRFRERAAVVCRGRADAVEKLRSGAVLRGQRGWEQPKVAFVFSGQGTQYVNMGRELYEHEVVYREAVDQCSEVLAKGLGLDLVKLLYAKAGEENRASEQLRETRVTQPALFVTEYALAQLWQSWGVKPSAVLGHSIGEYVAACLAGVFTVSEALRLVTRRGELMQQMAPGAMLAVGLGEEAIAEVLRQYPELSLAAVNAPGWCVVSGESEVVAAVERELVGVQMSRLQTSHAFHSAMMDPMLERYRVAVEQVKLRGPQLRCLSNVTGQWLQESEAVTAEYWVRHLREPVRYSAGLAELLREGEWVVLEVGPGQTLTALNRLQPDAGRHEFLNSLPAAKQQSDSAAYLLQTLARLWLAGVNVDWRQYYKGQQRRRVSLPTYPFQRQTFWIDPAPAIPATDQNGHSPHKKTEPVAPPADTALGELISHQLDLISEQLSVLEKMTG